MPVAFGASVDGVWALLPHRTLGPTSNPPESQVETFLAGGSGWVRSRAGAALDALDPADQRIEWARSLVELYGGAFAEDASFPEQAGPAGTTYGAVLWERFLKGLDELLEALGEPTEPGGEPGAPGAVVGPLLAHFPDPVLITGPLVPPFIAPNVGPPAPPSRTV